MGSGLVPAVLQQGFGGAVPSRVLPLRGALYGAPESLPGVGAATDMELRETPRTTAQQLQSGEYLASYLVTLRHYIDILTL